LTTEQKYTLKEARTLLGMSKRDLSKASGISLSAINSIENGGKFQTNNGVALALAEALALEVHEIKWPRGRSDLGRPAKTGKPITIRRTFTISVTEEITIDSEHPLCPRHFMVLPTGTGVCDFCSK
jgi:DNA-binding XRE family transcriptional regulator